MGDKTMPTLNQFVRNECANFKNGSCIWPPCTVVQGKRCHVSKAILAPGQVTDASQDYFAGCVEPMAKSFPEYTDAAIEYARICGRGVKAESKVRQCECGQPLAKSKQFCGTCAQKRHKENLKIRVFRHRATCNAKLPISQF